VEIIGLQVVAVVLQVHNHRQPLQAEVAVVEVLTQVVETQETIHLDKEQELLGFRIQVVVVAAAQQILLVEVDLVVPVSSSSHILHKYLKNYNGSHRRELYNTTRRNFL
jgi:hypothetical protein